MKIEFLKDYRYPGGGYSNKGDVQTFEDTEFVKWAIGNGFAEEVKESGWWKPKYGKRYYYLGEYGRIKVGTWNDCLWDNHLYAMGNVFRTEEAADRYCAYLKAEATVRQDEGVLTPEQAAKNGYIYYICVHNEFGLVVHGFNADYVSVNTVLFDTREHAQASRDNHPDEWKIIANYDWSKE